MIKGAEAEGPEVEAGVEAEVKVLEWGAGATGEAGAGIGAGVMDIALTGDMWTENLDQYHSLKNAFLLVLLLEPKGPHNINLYVT